MYGSDKLFLKSLFKDLMVTRKNRDYLRTGDIISNLRTIGYSMVQIQSLTDISLSTLYELAKISKDCTSEQRKQIESGKLKYNELRIVICKHKTTPKYYNETNTQYLTKTQELKKQIINTVAKIEEWNIYKHSELDYISVIPVIRLLEKKITILLNDNNSTFKTPKTQHLHTYACRKKL